MRLVMCIVLMLYQCYCFGETLGWLADLQKVFASTKKTEADGFTISELIDIAFSNNPDLQAMWLQYRQSAYAHAESRSVYYPSIDVNVNASRGRNPGLAINPPGVTVDQTRGSYYTSYGPQVALSFLVFDYGRRYETVRAAYCNMMSANWSYQWKVQKVLKDVLTAYYTYWDSRSSYEASLADLEDARRSLDAAEEKQKAGIVTLYDVLQARSLYAKQKMNSVKFFGGVNINYGHLVETIGLPLSSVLEIMPPSEELRSLEIVEDIATLIHIAEENRADLRAQKANVNNQKALMKSAGARGLPSIGFEFSGGDTSYNHTSQYGATNGINFLGMLSLKIPLFKGFADINRYRSQKQAWKASQSLMLSKQLEVNFEVLQSYYNVQTAGKNLVYSDEFYEAANENYGIAMENYKSGIGSILDLLSAQSSLAEARESRVSALTGWYLSLIDLSNVMGVLK